MMLCGEDNLLSVDIFFLWSEVNGGADKTKLDLDIYVRNLSSIGVGVDPLTSATFTGVIFRGLQRILDNRR